MKNNKKKTNRKMNDKETGKVSGGVIQAPRHSNPKPYIPPEIKPHPHRH